jgi:hypothetical protein
MSELWVELVYFDGVGIQTTYGTIEGTIKDAILNKADHEWVRLNKARNLDETGTKMEKIEDDIVGTESYLYLRARSIIRVAAVRPEVTFWEEGRAPLDHIAEAEGDN